MKSEYSKPPKEGLAIFLRRIINGLAYHHYWWMRDYELDVLKIFFQNLTSDNQQKLIWQLYRRDNFWRSKNGKIVSIGDRLIDSTPDWPEAPEYCVSMYPTAKKNAKSKKAGQKRNTNPGGIKFNNYKIRLKRSGFVHANPDLSSES